MGLASNSWRSHSSRRFSSVDVDADADGAPVGHGGGRRSAAIAPRGAACSSWETCRRNFAMRSASQASRSDTISGICPLARLKPQDFLKGDARPQVLGDVGVELRVTAVPEHVAIFGVEDADRLRQHLDDVAKTALGVALRLLVDGVLRDRLDPHRRHRSIRSKIR